MYKSLRPSAHGAFAAPAPGAQAAHLRRLDLLTGDAVLLPLLDGARVAPCQWNGVAAFVKRKTRRRAAERVLLTLLRPWLQRWLAPGERAAPAHTGDPLGFELARLQGLAAAGAAVPRVLAVSASAFVLETVGPSLEQLLRDADACQAQALLVRAARDLAAFHGAGHWHGGAQIRNTSLHHGRVTRFDFDREFDALLPLSVLQALDAWLFVMSTLAVAGPPAVQAAAAAYCADCPRSAREVLRRTAPWALRLGGAGWARRLAAKESGRLRAAAGALATALGPRP